jgi:hydrogenase maturation protein HypF
MELEFAIQPDVEGAYPFHLRGGAPLIVDWQPMIEGIVSDLRRRESIGVIAAKFHNTLAEIIVAVAREVGEPKVLLTGGCFQNRYLTERAVDGLRSAGFTPYWHRLIPPNDGGIALGQIIAAAWAMRGAAREQDVDKI